MQTLKQTSSNQRLAVSKQARNQLGMLTAMFLLGMGVNLIGLPSETSGSGKHATTILLGLHVLIGVGLIVGGMLTVLKARSLGFLKLAWIGLVAITLTFATGALTMATESNWWSYAMSVGFIVSFWVYGLLFSRTRVEA